MLQSFILLFKTCSAMEHPTHFDLQYLFSKCNLIYNLPILSCSAMEHPTQRTYDSKCTIIYSVT